jgi:hypothetical protein
MQPALQSSKREKYYQQEEPTIRGQNIAALDSYMVQILKNRLPSEVYVC